MGTGLPPQTPPDVYSSNVIVVGVVGVVLTRRRESADFIDFKAYLKISKLY